MKKVLLLATLALLCLALFPGAAQAATTSFEAESMALSGAAYLYPNATWASGGAMIYTTNATGAATDTRSYPAGKLTKVDIVANSYKSKGSASNPVMRLSIDGVSYSTAGVAPGSLRTFSTTLPSLPAGTHTVKVSEASGPSSYHELQIDKLTVTDDGSTPPPSGASCDPSLGCQLFATPAYWDASNTALYQQLDGKSYAQGKGAAAVEVVNAASGPGSAYNSTLDAAIKDAQAHGVKAIGYVNTSAAPGTSDTSPRRPLADVNAEVDEWYRWYGVDGIFEDNFGQRSDTDSFHQSVYDHIKSDAGVPGKAPNGHFDASGARHDYVFGNISWNFDEYKMQTADVIVDFEDTYSYYTSGAWDSMFVAYSPFITSGAYGPERFMQIIEGTAYADLPSAVSLTKQRNAGWVDVDDDVQGYNNLPTDPYWSDEQTLLLANR